MDKFEAKARELLHDYEVACDNLHARNGDPRKPERNLEQAIAAALREAAGNIDAHMQELLRQRDKSVQDLSAENARLKAQMEIARDALRIISHIATQPHRDIDYIATLLTARAQAREALAVIGKLNPTKNDDSGKVKATNDVIENIKTASNDVSEDII